MARHRGQYLLWGAATLAVLFGGATVASGGRVLFGGPAARAAVGDAVAFVVWFNFFAGFAYMAAGIGIALQRRWSAGLSALIAGATIAVFAAFGVHVALGGAYEPRTVAALALRTITWCAIAVLTFRAMPAGGDDAERV